MDFVVAVSKQWLLDKGVAPDATSIDASIFQELTESVTEVASWADPAVLKKNAKAMTLDAQLSEVPAAFPSG